MSFEQNIDSPGNRFSVAMCVYEKDNPQHFKQAVESIICQTKRPDEVILVVDGPVPDSIKQVVKAYEGEAWFKVIWLSENVGHGNARRIGLENCSNELVALMDADDISVPNRFEKQLECFTQDGNISIVGGMIKEFIYSVDNVTGIRQVPLDDRDIKHYMKKRCPFNQVTVMFKKSDVEAAGGYLDWHHEEDYYLWIRMYEKNFLFKNLDEVLVFVRVGHDMYQRRGGWMYFKSESRLQLYMLSKGIITLKTFLQNISIRFILQVIMPSKVRGIVFRKFARKTA